MKRIKNLFRFFCAATVLVFGGLFLAALIGYLRNEAMIDHKAEDYLVPLSGAIRSFRNEYHEWPGPAGKINDAFICELEGCPNAIINSKHIDFFALHGASPMKTNRFGFYFEFYPAKASLDEFWVGTPIRDPKTGGPSTLFTLP